MKFPLSRPSIIQVVSWASQRTAYSLPTYWHPKIGPLLVWGYIWQRYSSCNPKVKFSISGIKKQPTNEHQSLSTEIAVHCRRGLAKIPNHSIDQQGEFFSSVSPLLTKVIRKNLLHCTRILVSILCHQRPRRNHPWTVLVSTPPWSFL